MKHYQFSQFVKQINRNDLIQRISTQHQTRKIVKKHPFTLKDLIYEPIKLQTNRYLFQKFKHHSFKQKASTSKQKRVIIPYKLYTKKTFHQSQKKLFSFVKKQNKIQIKRNYKKKKHTKLLSKKYINCVLQSKLEQLIDQNKDQLYNYFCKFECQDINRWLQVINLSKSECFFNIFDVISSSIKRQQRTFRFKIPELIIYEFFKQQRAQQAKSQQIQLKRKLLETFDLSYKLIKAKNILEEIGGIKNMRFLSQKIIKQFSTCIFLGPKIATLQQKYTISELYQFCYYFFKQEHTKLIQEFNSIVYKITDQQFYIFKQKLWFLLFRYKFHPRLIMKIISNVERLKYFAINFDYQTLHSALKIVIRNNKKSIFAYFSNNQSKICKIKKKNKGFSLDILIQEFVELFQHRNISKYLQQGQSELQKDVLIQFTDYAIQHLSIKLKNTFHEIQFRQICLKIKQHYQGKQLLRNIDIKQTMRKLEKTFTQQKDYTDYINYYPQQENHLLYHIEDEESGLKFFQYIIIQLIDHFSWFCPKQIQIIMKHRKINKNIFYLWISCLQNVKKQSQPWNQIIEQIKRVFKCYGNQNISCNCNRLLNL